MRRQKGITLIALIITIVVLLILAVVTIGAINDSDIINYAENAATDYEKAKTDENKALEGYLEMIEQTLTGNTKGKWKQEGNNITNGEIVLKVGDKVEYDEGTGHTTTPDETKGVGVSYNGGLLTSKTYNNENLEWRVLGVNNNGMLELISTNPTTDKLMIYGEEGYLNAETKEGLMGTLDMFCNDLYGKGIGAKYARSLNVEDINGLANYNPEIEGVTEGWLYNTEYTFKYDDDANIVKSTTDPSKDISEWDEISEEVYLIDGSVVDAEHIGPVTIKSTEYEYSISEYVKSKIEDDAILLSDIISKGETNSSYIDQWLSSTAISLAGGFPDYQVRVISRGYVDGFPIIENNGVVSNNCVAVRPVVVLKSEAKISDLDNNGILNVY